MSDLVLYEVKDRIGYITLNRPAKRNALSFEFVNEIKTNFSRAEEDDHCKVIVLRSNGDAFCAGADLSYIRKMQSNSAEENLTDSKNLMRLLRMIYLSPKIVIAQVNGPALAGGCGLANVCDFTFASTTSTFGYTEVKIGFIPAIVMVFLIRKIGEQKAKELLLTGEIIDAKKAVEMGIVKSVVEPELLEKKVTEFAHQLCITTSSQSVALMKEMFNDVQNESLRNALEYAAEMNAKARNNHDCKIGIDAFLNKEKLTW